MELISWLLKIVYNFKTSFSRTSSRANFMTGAVSLFGYRRFVKFYMPHYLHFLIAFRQMQSVRKFISVFLLILAFPLNKVSAQHCAPIVESYLSATQIFRTEDGLRISMRYRKTGGQVKEAYQAYVVAYSQKNFDQVLKLSPQEAIEQKLAVVIHTQLANLNEKGEYEIGFSIKTNDLEAEQLSLKNTTNIGGWKSFDSPLRLSIFVPFLEDAKYSHTEGLPKDKHECNYSNLSALLFDPLPIHLNIRFGIVQARRLRDGEYYIEMNGQRPETPSNKNR
jgi:hypothetical protein